MNRSIPQFYSSILILVLINVIAAFLYFRLDLTEEKKHSIKKETIEILNQIDDIVYVKVYLEGDFPAGFVQLRNACYNLLEEFKIRNSNGENFIYISFLAIVKTINKLLSIIRNFDGNKFVKYKYLELEKNQINNLNKFYEYIQKKKKFKKI